MSFTIKQKNIDAQPKIRELYESGLGFKEVSRLTGIPRQSVRRAVLRMGIKDQSRLPHHTTETAKRSLEGRRRSLERQGIPTIGHFKKINPDKFLFESLKDECKSVAKFDPDNWWYGTGYDNGHPECARWYGRRHARRQHARGRTTKNNHYLAKLLRSRIYCVLKGHKKSASTMVLLGCDIGTFKRHLSSRFKRGMTWDNYGHAWHIDHIQPCASFDLSNPQDQRKCFHFSNMQPMFAKDNISKGASVVECQPEFTLQINGNVSANFTTKKTVKVK